MPMGGGYSPPPAPPGYATGVLVVNIIRYYCCKQNAKKIENEETRLFCHIFVIKGISIGGPGPPGYAYDCNFNAICDTKIL